jgi:hypothetical protein
VRWLTAGVLEDPKNRSMVRSNGIRLLLGILLLLLIRSAVEAQQQPKLVYDSTGQLVPASRIPAAAQPQQPLPVRRGPWLNLGLAFGSVGCVDSCSSIAPAAEVSAGWPVSPRLSLGVGITGWTKEGPTHEYEGATIRLSVGSVALRARFYPQRNAGFFLSGGLGLGITRLSDERGSSFTQTGAGFLGGFGCDLWMRPHLSLTPFVDFSTTRAWSDNDLRDDLWRMGLGVTIH